MTVAAAEWFAERHVDLAVYEVGLGGRFDSTTALPVDASVITAIELEHMDVLGDSIAAIAGEKAAIVRPGGLALTATHGEALAVTRARATEVGARLLVLGEDLRCREVAFADDGCRFRLQLPGGEHPVFLPDARAIEVPALALAAAALAELLPDLPLALDPAPRPDLPGRFEQFVEPDGETLVLDGAHTEQSLGALAREVARRWPGRRCPVLFATATGKRWRQGLSRLLAVADTVVVTGLLGTPSEDPAAIASWLGSRGVQCELASDVASGLAALRRGPGPRLVTGSFYLVGQVRLLVATESPRVSDERT
jgi:dihydrofolate synthase/folylpolyglutamate synthase